MGEINGHLLSFIVGNPAWTVSVGSKLPYHNEKYEVKISRNLWVDPNFLQDLASTLCKFHFSNLLIQS